MMTARVAVRRDGPPAHAAATAGLRVRRECIRRAPHGAAGGSRTSSSSPRQSCAAQSLPPERTARLLHPRPVAVLQCVRPAASPCQCGGSLGEVVRGGEWSRRGRLVGCERCTCGRAALSTTAGEVVSAGSSSQANADHCGRLPSPRMRYPLPSSRTTQAQLAVGAPSPYSAAASQHPVAADADERSPPSKGIDAMLGDAMATVHTSLHLLALRSQRAAARQAAQTKQVRSSFNSNSTK